MQIVRQQAFARAGLVGNPSDGYNGKTISLIVRNYCATVILYEWEKIELLLSREDQSRFDSVDELVTDVDLHGYYGGIRLVKATIKRFVEFCRARQAAGDHHYALSDRRFSIRYESNIPRQVGMAGSSAIIVATLRALMEFYEITIPETVLPSLALSVEIEELGIAAGLQDRVIQVYEGLVYMDFDRGKMHEEMGLTCGAYERLPMSALPRLYMAFSTEQGEPTEVQHAPLRARYERGDEDVRRAMIDFANYAAEARDAILAGDHATLASLIDQNFDRRKSICSLDPGHVQMIEAARSAGASAKFAGSGGAIIGTYRDEAIFARLQQTLGSIRCCVFQPLIDPTTCETH
ncbi:MAG: hypothetical protein KDA60_14865 [Planctomycetales bacterium]|nr:hypothetical protein [Planctomycetales bacterium]